MRRRRGRREGEESEHPHLNTAENPSVRQGGPPRFGLGHDTAVEVPSYNSFIGYNPKYQLKSQF